MFEFLAPLGLQDLHFVRPWWCATILPALLLGWSLTYRQAWQSGWQKYIDPVLLAPLLKGKVNRPGKLFPLMLIGFWVLGALALAGPAWKKLPQPVKKVDNALVILLDLSPSMLAGDIKPARLVAARHKIIDLLKARREGYTALVAYSGDAHIVAPLTDDTQTITNLVNVLEPGIMPVHGSNVEHALQSAFHLFENSGYSNGDILLVTDGITAEALQHSTTLLQGKNFILSIIGVGTESGGPIPSARGGFIKDEQGNILMPALRATYLRQLADNVGGYYSLLQLDDSDITPLLTGRQTADQQKTRSTEREFDQWQDQGAYLVLPLLLVLLLAFRRGVIFSALLSSLWLGLAWLPSPTAQAGEHTAAQSPLSWDALWLNADQRAMKALQQQDFDSAAEQFRDPDWKAAAQYEKGDYGNALKQFRQDHSSEGLYNQGNALAKSGDLKGAIHAYQQALKHKPLFEDARFNKSLVEKLLQEQTSDQNTQGETQQQDKQQNNEPEKSDSSTKGETPADQAPDELSPSETGDQKQSATEKNNGEERQAQENDPSPKPDTPPSSPETANARAEDQPTPPSEEEKQAMEQWLRKIPDDPSALLRNKFEYYYQQQLQQQQRGKTAAHLNDEERW